MLSRPIAVDKEIAREVFRQHADGLSRDDRVMKAGWEFIWLDDLHLVVKLQAKRQDNTQDQYCIHLGAEYYDTWPPTVAFVIPDTWEHAQPNTRWWPTFANRPSWFQLHANFNVMGESRQLVCYSRSAEYYMTDHSPKPSEIWQQGKHTVASTLWRLNEVLHPPYYSGPSNAHHP